MVNLPIFEPLWKCEFPTIQQFGEGCIDRTGWNADTETTLESFSVRHAGYEVTVVPSRGEVLLDGTLAIKTEAGKLIWFRQMQCQIGMRDTNNRSPIRCNFYCIGVHNASGRHGYRMYEDGRLLTGIE